MDALRPHTISNVPSSEEELRYQTFRVMLQSDGGDPSTVLEMLASIFERQDWTKLKDETGRPMGMHAYFRLAGWRFEDLGRFVECMRHRYEIAGNISQKIVDRMKLLRSRVRQELDAIGYKPTHAFLPLADPAELGRVLARHYNADQLRRLHESALASNPLPAPVVPAYPNGKLF